MKLSTDTKLIGLGLLAAAGALWYLTRTGNAAKIGAGVVGAVADAGAGMVRGLGAVVGIPDTNATKCQQDMAAGRYWDASFSCPAGTYIAGLGTAAKGAVFGSTAISAAEAADARRDFAATDPRRLDLAAPSYGSADPLESDSGMNYRYF